jgi:hypothetical protein
LEGHEGNPTTPSQPLIAEAGGSADNAEGPSASPPGTASAPEAEPPLPPNQCAAQLELPLPIVQDVCPAEIDAEMASSELSPGLAADLELLFGPSPALTPSTKPPPVDLTGPSSLGSTLNITATTSPERIIAPPTFSPFNSRTATPVEAAPAFPPIFTHGKHPLQFHVLPSDSREWVEMTIIVSPRCLLV